MKKRITIICVILALVIGSCYYISLPDYKIVSSSSMSNSYNGTRDTCLNVVAYRYWNIDTLAKDILQKHSSLNGVSTSLEINLYYSQWHMKNSSPFKVILFE